MKKNILANLLGRFWGILSNFLFIPLYIHYLGFESYSIISFTLLIAGIMAILDAGLTATLSREFARMDRTDSEKISVYKTLESAYFLVVLLCTLIVFFSSPYIAKEWLNLKSYSHVHVSYFLKIISFDIGFQLLFRFYMGGLLGLGKQVNANIYQVIWGMLRNGLVVVVLIINPTLEAFFIWQTLCTITFAVLLKISLESFLFGKYMFSLRFRIEKTVFKQSWEFAGGMMLIALVAALNTQMDKIAISKMLSLESLGYYTLAISLSQGIIVLVNPIATAVLPLFTAQYSSGGQKEASKLFLKVSLMVSVLVFTIMANLFFFGEKIVWVWTGDAHLAKQISTVIPVVALAYAMLSLQVIPYQIAIANGYTRMNNLLGVISLFVTIPGYIYVTRFYGAIGAAAVFCTVQTMITFVYLYFINKKFLNLKVITVVFGKHIFLTLIITLVLAYGFSLVPGFYGESRMLAFLWVGCTTTCTLIITLLILVPFKTLKATITNSLNMKRINP